MSMLAHLKQISPDRAQIGDLVVYGGDPKAQHVVVIVETGSDPTVASHGSEKGPLKLPLSQVTAAHQGQPVVHLSLL
jgi:cell wall-associated NlpC family hydrolase